MIVPTLEVLPGYRRHNITHALFDFDGTLSCIRDGWTEIMVDVFCDALAIGKSEGKFGEPNSLAFLVRDDIASLTGRQTIIQMQRLAERVKQFGGTPKDPEEYKAEFLRRLEKKMEAVIFGLTTGELEFKDYLVRGAYEFLGYLDVSVFMHLFSGTDQGYVCRDVELLRIVDFFEKIHGASPDLQASSKKAVIQKVLNENRITGDNLVVFGDGLVEILEAKAVGALAVGVASREGHNGERDEAKRNRLVEAGADLIITDYQKFELWMPMVIGE